MNGHLTVYIAQTSHYLLHLVAPFSKENQEKYFPLSAPFSCLAFFLPYSCLETERTGKEKSVQSHGNLMKNENSLEPIEWQEITLERKAGIQLKRQLALSIKW